jgi:UDP-N-acetyl-D-glucosamine dehydrogenase
MNEVVKGIVKKIEQRDYTIGVMGLGYVGLPLAETFFLRGFHVIGFDRNPESVNRATERLGIIMGEGRFEATQDISRLPECDAILICVPTPLGRNKQPDLSAVVIATQEITDRLRKGQLVVLESTTYPGTTREVVLPLLDRGRCALGEDHELFMAPGQDYFLAFSPERVDPGRDVKLADVPKIVGGVEDNSYEVAKALYAAAFSEVVGVSNTETAEATKLLENIYRAVNIALVNELKCIFQDMSIPEIPIDIWEVIQAASTKPYGFQPFYPGPGVGGHCIPLDPFYLSWKAKEAGWPTRFIELAGEINEAMPDYVVQRAMLALNERGKALSKSKILVMGIAYKPDVGDARESPGTRIFYKFRKLGAAVYFDDPHVEQMPGTTDRSWHTYEDGPEMEDFDAVVVITAHSAYDWEAIQQKAQLLIDTRNVVDGENVVRA